MSHERCRNGAREAYHGLDTRARYQQETGSFLRVQLVAAVILLLLLAAWCPGVHGI